MYKNLHKKLYSLKNAMATAWFVTDDKWPWRHIGTTAVNSEQEITYGYTL